MLTSAGLTPLTRALLVLHARTYGVVVVVLAGTDAPPPVGNRYQLALALGVVVNLAGALGVAWWECGRGLEGGGP